MIRKTTNGDISDDEFEPVEVFISDLIIKIWFSILAEIGVLSIPLFHLEIIVTLVVFSVI